MTVPAPTFVGFLAFVRRTMGISTAVLPDSGTVLEDSYALALETVNRAIRVSPLNYVKAVYNFAGDALINEAPDQTGQTFFADLREKWNILDPISGVVASSGDVSTNQSLVVPEQFSTLTLADLQQFKTPYGRAYVAIAQQYGALWGIS